MTCYFEPLDMYNYMTGQTRNPLTIHTDFPRRSKNKEPAPFEIFCDPVPSPSPSQQEDTIFALRRRVRELEIPFTSAANTQPQASLRRKALATDRRRLRRLASARAAGEREYPAGEAGLKALCDGLTMFLAGRPDERQSKLPYYRRVRMHNRRVRLARQFCDEFVRRQGGVEKAKRAVQIVLRTLERRMRFGVVVPWNEEFGLGVSDTEGRERGAWLVISGVCESREEEEGIVSRDQSSE